MMMTTTTKMMIASEEKGKRNNRVVVSICIRIYSLQSCCFSFAREKERKKRSSSSMKSRRIESISRFSMMMRLSTHTTRTRP